MCVGALWGQLLYEYDKNGYGDWVTCRLGCFDSIAIEAPTTLQAIFEYDSRAVLDWYDTAKNEGT